MKWCFNLILIIVPVILMHCSPERKATVVTSFSYDITTDSSSGWHIVRLRAENSDDARQNISIGIVPEAGCNLFSLVAGETELIDADAVSELTAGGRGCFLMYPAPNRVRDGEYDFMGTSYSMLLPGEERHNRLHGLVRDQVWEYDEPVVVDDQVSFTARYRFDKDNPRLAAFPFENVLSVTFTVMKDRARVAYSVENTGDSPLGFGFGLHPFWKAIGSRDQCRIQVDVPTHMVATQELLPTGEVENVVGTAYDLTEPVTVSKLNLDDVYLGAKPDSNVNMYFDALGLVLKQRATGDFTHVVVYTPDREYFCVENQTCSTDAHNLFARGLEKESHLQVVDAGAEAGGHVDFILEWTAE